MVQQSSLLVWSVYLRPLMLLVVVWVAGCSGSSEPTATSPQASNQPVVIEQVPSNDDNAIDENSDTTDVEPDNSGEEISEPVDTFSDPANVPAVVDDPVIENTDSDVESPVVADPLIQNTIQVSFDITVPQYQSNQLRVEVTWGNTKLVANWVGDELWTASGDFPTDTQHLLTVTFYDRNGRLKLASFSQDYKTGSNVSESFKVSADQLDASQYDNDGDGRNNLRELIEGSDPDVHEDASLPVQESFEVGTDSRMSVYGNFESQITEERPYSFSSTELRYPEYSDETDSTIIKIDIDGDGNGTLSHRQDYFCEWVSYSGTRIRKENSISWEAGRYESNCDYHHSVDTTHTVTINEDGTRQIVQDLEGSNKGTYQYSWEVSTNLTAELIEGTSMCKPIAGRIYVLDKESRDGYSEHLTIIEKEVGDQYWRVFEKISKPKFSNNQIVSVQILSEREFFAREIFSGKAKCDFVDFK